MPAAMFDVKETAICLPEKARMFDSYVCDCCGKVAGGKKLCLDCYDTYDRFNV